MSLYMNPLGVAKEYQAGDWAADGDTRSNFHARVQYTRAFFVGLISSLNVGRRRKAGHMDRSRIALIICPNPQSDILGGKERLHSWPNLLSDSPYKTSQFSGYCSANNSRFFAALNHFVVAGTEARLSLPRNITHFLGCCTMTSVLFVAIRARISVAPCGLYEHTSGFGIPCFCDASATYFASTGMFRRG